MNNNLPLPDKEDLSKDCRNILPEPQKCDQGTAVRQAQPEYAQSGYLRLRAQEEMRPLYNYLEPDLNPRFKQHLIEKRVFESDYRVKVEEFQNDRSYAVQKIMDMHQCQDPASFFTAVQIYDTFLEQYGHWEFPRDKICCLAMSCLRLALKFENRLVIRINDIESVLYEEDVRFTQQQLNKMEFKVLQFLNFDLSFPSFTQPIERFLRLLNYDHSN